MMYLLLLLAYLLLITKVSSTVDTCSFYYANENNIGFISSVDLGNSRCQGVANPNYCCRCPYGKMVPPSIDNNQIFHMKGER